MSSVTAIPAPSAVYHEDQLFGWWVYALMAGMVALACVFVSIRSQGGAEVANGGFPFSLGITVGFALPTVFVLGVLRMTTEVAPTGIDVWFGWIPTYRRKIDLASIRAVEAITYQPFADYGGWGIRFGRDGEKALNARGDRGVRLIMIDGSKLMIGSQRPEELAASIEGAMRPTG